MLKVYLNVYVTKIFNQAAVCDLFGAMSCSALVLNDSIERQLLLMHAIFDYGKWKNKQSTITFQLKV